MMNTVIAMITVIIKVTTVTILLPPWNVTKGREKGSDVKLYLLQPHSGSAHCTRMRLHFTCLSRIFRRKRFTGCWLPQMPWDLDFLLPCLIVPSRSSKLALDLDVLLNHVFLKHSKCIEHFHRKCSKNFATQISHTLHVASPWTANIFRLVTQFWSPDVLHTVAVDVETSRTEGSLLQVATTYEWNSRNNK